MIGNDWGRTLFAKVYVPNRVCGCPRLHFRVSPFDKERVPDAKVCDENIK